MLISIDGTDGRSDGQTDRFIDSAPHAMRSSVNKLKKSLQIVHKFSPRTSLILRKSDSECINKQMVKLFRHKARSPPRANRSIVFTR